ASGSLAELRAFGAMLSTADDPTGGLGIVPHHGKGRAPDFRVGRLGDAYVEVCCIRINADERRRQAHLDSVEAELRERAREAAEAHQLAESAPHGSSAYATAEWTTA